MKGVFACLAVFLFFGTLQVVVSFTSRSKYELYGRFGKDVFQVLVEFDVDMMLVTLSDHPDYPPTNTRHTTNLHVFSMAQVAMKSEENKQCYVQHFRETLEEFRGRAMNANETSKELSGLVEELVSIDDQEPLPREHYGLLAQDIIHFCRGKDVFVLNDLSTYPHTPEELHRQKRAVSAGCFSLSRACNEYGRVPSSNGFRNDAAADW